jgi:type I restriction enzyme R subunit
MSEVHVVHRFLNRLEELGWKFVDGRCPSRGVTVSDPILDRVFDESFRRLNWRVLETEGLGDRVDAVLTKVRDLLRKSEPHEVLKFLRRGEDVREGGKLVRVFLIDYENVENNEFLACPEVSFPGERGQVRPDVVLYVNGIPLVVVEVKDPLRLGERAIEEGYNQLRRYERQYPELFKYVQVGVVYTDEVGSVYMPMSSVLGGGDRWYGRWRDEVGKYDIFGLLDRARFLEVLRWFVFYKGQRKDQKVVPRYNQYWATYKAVKRAREYLLGNDDRNRGLIWHWQGSGKTYIMFYIAYQFFHRFLERDPLVFFVVDRRELQRQLYDEFIKDLYAPHFQEYVKTVESIDKLKSILRDIAEREANGQATGRGVYIVLVQKFRPDEFKDVKPIKKKEVLILLDEAHRSVYGVLGATLNRLFPNAVKFAFTGTPVMRYERNTFEYFSYPQEELYLDKYFIADSIKDGYTVPLRYQVVQEIGDLRINVSEREIQELLERWVNNMGEVSSLDDADEEGSVTVEEIRRRLNRIKVFLENPERLRRIAEYIAERIEEDTEAFRFKAIVVTASRLACVRMKRALDETLSRRFGEEAKKWSEVVMTYTNNDPEEIQSYMEEMLKRWRGPEGLRAWEEANRRIQERFKDGEDPRILIVTDMLITGFDFPRLKVMYLDKPLFEHRLLQAIARVNRPYRSGDVEKQFGLVIDFVGLLEHVKEALARYELLDNETLSDLFETSINRVTEALRQLDALIRDIKRRLLDGVRIGVHKVKIDIDSLVNRLSDEDVYEELSQAALLLAMGFDSDVNVSRLVSDMRRAFSLYRALGAYPEKEKVRADIAILHKLYMGIMYHVKGLRLPNGFWSDLINLIHKKTIIPEIGVVDEVTLEPSIFDELLRHVKMIRGFLHSPKAMYTTVDVLLTLKGLLRDRLSNPVYRVIYERLKELEEEWRSRSVSLAMIDRLKELLSELARYERERREKSLPERLAYDVKEFISSQYKIHVEKLVNTEQVLQRIINRYVSVPVSTFYEQDRKELRTALLKDLFKILSMKEVEVQQIAHALADYIESEVVYELRRNR